MAVHVVLDEADVPEGGHRIVQVDGREVGVYRIGGQYYAIMNYCPHQGAPVCVGYVSGTNLPSDVYEYKYARQGQILRCPWHGWEFDIKTGESLFSSKFRVKTYEVEVKDGKIGIVTGKP